MSSDCGAAPDSPTERERGTEERRGGGRSQAVVRGGGGGKL